VTAFREQPGAHAGGSSGDEVFPSDELRFTYSSEHPLQFALLYADEHTASVDPA
jgi:hypothetical protein